MFLPVLLKQRLSHMDSDSGGSGNRWTNHQYNALKKTFKPRHKNCQFQLISHLFSIICSEINPCGLGRRTEYCLRVYQGNHPQVFRPHGQLAWENYCHLHTGGVQTWRAGGVEPQAPSPTPSEKKKFHCNRLGPTEIGESDESNARETYLGSKFGQISFFCCMCFKTTNRKRVISASHPAG